MQKISKKEAARQHQIEVSENFKAFKKELPELIAKNHRGEYALMKNRKIVKLFPDMDAALIAGHKKYPGEPFSVQCVTDKVINFGVRAYVRPE